MNYTAETYSNTNPTLFYGGGFCGGVDPRREQYAGEDVAGVAVPNYKTKYEALQNVIKDNYQLFEVDYYGIDNDDYVSGEGFCCGESMQSRSIPVDNADYEKLQYYYHSDHLGSASYITNLDGEVVQHIEYVPFGEVFLEERNNIWNTPFLFNGKELDEETGLYYYGARYYNPRVSQFLSTDRYAEKYPDASPYQYCLNNPINALEINGDSINVSELTSSQLERYNSGIELLKESEVFSEYYSALEKSETIYTISAQKGKEGTSSSEGQFFNPKTKEVGLGESMNTYAVAQELFHAYQSDGGFYMNDKPTPYSTIETEGDIVTMYVMMEAGLGFPSYGEWGNDFQFDSYEGIPSINKIQSKEYQNMFQNAVNNRINYYKGTGLNAPTYTSPNRGVKPKAFESIIKQLNNDL